MRKKYGQGHKGVVPQYAEPEDFDWSRPIANGPVTRGFDTYFGTHVPNQPPYCFIENDRVVGTPSEMLRKGGVPGPMVPGHKLVDILPAITRRATEVIARRAAEKRPFFLYFALTSPHEPVAPSKDWQGKSGISPLADFIMQTDDTVGQVLQALEKNGAAGNTLVIFTADNGASYYTGLKDHLKAGHRPSGPYRGYKADIWEGGHRVPFIARWPGKIKPGTHCRNTVCLTDLMATCAAITGAKLPVDAGVDSVSFLPNLLDADSAPPREATVHQAANGTLSLRRGKWKLIAPAQLYDLETDVAEKQDVAADHPGIVEELTTLLQLYIATGRSTPGPKQPNDVLVSLGRTSTKP
jgi:arylsulfatase A-like enzyme